MNGRRILVLGDMVADIYLDGIISRISREAPVLVLEQAAERIVAGGAANVVNNVATLGGQVFAAGLLARLATPQRLGDNDQDWVAMSQLAFKLDDKALAERDSWQGKLFEEGDA